MKRIITCFIVLIISWGAGSLSSFGQDTTTVQAKALNYYKVEIGIVIDCPVLPVRFHDQVKGLQGIKDYKKDKSTQSLFFTIPEGVITKEQVTAIAVKCGFPAHLVNVLIDTKPFTN